MTNLYADAPSDLTYVTDTTYLTGQGEGDPREMPRPEYPEARAAWHDAFAQFQAIVNNPSTNKTLRVSGRPDTRYADLASILETSRPVLAAHGLSVAQDVTVTGNAVSVTTRVFHKAGHVETFGPLLMPAGGNAQAIGSAVTYGRRYALAAALGLAADDDDDGERAVKEQRGQHQRRPSAPPSAEEAVLPTSAALAEGTHSAGGGDAGGKGKALGVAPPVEPNDPGDAPTHPGPDAAPRLGDAAPSSPGSTKPKPHKDHRPNYDVAPNEHGVVPCAEPGCKAFVKLEKEA